MPPLSSRCRHFEVNWLNSHTCLCSGCQKTGHWFEKEGLVMWVLDQAIEDLENPSNSANRIEDMNVTENSVSSKAG